jgi:hypothetical protein
MITGFNTDVSYEGTTYHVQTEDKGASNPIIESLIYVRGAILAAKRTSYAKELEHGLVEDQLQTILEKQHRTILAVIRAGRIQELVQKLSKQRVEPGAITGSPAPAVQFEPPPPQPIQQPSAPATATAQYAQVDHLAQGPEPEPVITPAGNGHRTSGSLEGEPAKRTSGSLEGGPGKGDSQPLFAEFDLDKIIFDYLQTDAQEEKLEIKLRGNNDFYAGEVVTLQIEISRGGIQPLPNVPVIVKIIGTAFKPQIYSGRTGPDGVAIMPVTLPNFTAGSAAIVVQSSSEAGEAEIKQLIRRR